MNSSAATTVGLVLLGAMVIFFVGLVAYARHVSRNPAPRDSDGGDVWGAGGGSDGGASGCGGGSSCSGGHSGCGGGHSGCGGGSSCGGGGCGGGGGD